MKTPTCLTTKYFARLCTLILPLASLVLGSSAVFGATDIYTGQNATNGNFSNSNNWQGTKPGIFSHDDLVFGSVTATQLTANNNTATFAINSITFVDPTIGTAQSFNITGSAVVLGTGKGANNVIIDSSASSAAQTVSLNFGVLPSTSLLHIVTGESSLTINSNILLLSASLGFEGPGLITVNGQITGAGTNSRAATLVIGDFSTSTSGNVLLAGNNVNLLPNSSGYSVNLQNGSLTIGNTNALGTGNLLINGTTNNVLASNAAYSIANGITANISFTVLPTENLQINGAVNLTPVDSATSIVVTNGTAGSQGSIQFNGGVTGGGVGNSIVLQGIGNSSDLSHFIISGNTASTYVGTMIVDNEANLELNVTPAHSAITGDLSITQGSVVTLDQSNQLTTTANLNVDGGFEMNGHQETIDSLTGEGTVTIGAGGQLTFNSGNFGGVGVTALTDGLDIPGGQVVKNGAGTFTLYGASDYSGNTTINEGVFAAGAFFVLDANSRYVVNSTGTLAIMGKNNSIGSLTGNGVVENGGASVAGITVGADNTSTQFRGTIQDGDGGGALYLTKIGNGALYLKGNNTYSAGTTLDNGELIVGSPTALGSGDVVVTGGTLRLGHTGSPMDINVGGSYAQFGGALQLAVFGGATNDNDALVVSGNFVSLNQASTLHLFSLNGGVVASTDLSYDLIHNNAGNIMGTFGTVTGLSNFVIPTGLFGTLDYTPTDVTLVFRQYLGLTPGLTPNQQTIANFLDRMEGINTAGNFGKVVDGLYNGGPAGLPGNLDQLSPEQFAKFTSVTAFNNASFETQAMDNYLNSLRHGANGTFVGSNGTIDSSGLTVNDPSYDPALAQVHSRLLAWSPTPQSGLLSDSGDAVLGGVEMKDQKDMKSMAAPAYTNPWNVFVRGNVILAQGFSQTDVGHFNDNTESVVIGTDYRLCPNFLIGATLGYANTSATLDNNGSSANVDSYSPGVYAAWANKGWYANFSGAYTYNSYSETRNIAFLGQNSTGSSEGNEGVVNLDGGYDFHSGGMTFGPLIGLQYTHLTVNGFNEGGSAASLNVNQDQSDSLRSRLGGRVDFNTKMFGINVNPHLDASWQHEFMDQSRGITSQFNGFGGGSFIVQTNNPSRESALVDAGINIDVTDTITVFTDYMAQAGQSNYFGQSVQAGAKIGF